MSTHGRYSDRPILAELYDLVPAYRQRPDVEFYLRRCREADGPILELGCGTGRILLPAARAKCRMTGLDISEHMLSRCRYKLQQEDKTVQDRVQLIQGKMSEFSLEQDFALAIIPFHAFQHLISVEEQMACLRRVHGHLKAKGRLILDVFQVKLRLLHKVPLGEEIEDTPEFAMPDGRRLRRTHRLVDRHPSEQYNDVEMIYYLTEPDNTTQRIVQAFPFRYFFRYEVERLLARCGFTITDLFGDFAASPLTDNSPEMIFLATKR
jgi:SAM-dependent methyltransferase